MARYLAFGKLLVEDVVCPTGASFPDGSAATRCTRRSEPGRSPDDVELVTRLGRRFPPELVRALEEAATPQG